MRPQRQEIVPRFRGGHRGARLLRVRGPLSSVPGR